MIWDLRFSALGRGGGAVWPSVQNETHKNPLGYFKELLCLVSCVYQKKQELTAAGKKLSPSDKTTPRSERPNGEFLMPKDNTFTRP